MHAATSMKSSRIVWLNASSVVPWLAVAIVVVVTALVNHAIDLGSLTFSISIPDDALTPRADDLLATSKHLLARVAWGVPAIGFGLISIAVAASAIVVMANCVAEVPASERGKNIAVIAFAAAALFVIIAYFGDQIMSEPEVTTNLRKATLHRIASGHLCVVADSFFDVVSYAIFLLLLCAASATLVKAQSTIQAIAQVCQRIKQVQWLLYIGAAALVLRDIEMYMLYRWPQIWFAKEQADAIDHMALALSTAHGAFFSAILMALYLPTAFILRTRTKLLAEQAVVGTNEQPETWLEKSGFNSSPFKQLANVFATITPLLAGGTVAKLVGVLTA